MLYSIHAGMPDGHSNFSNDDVSLLNSPESRESIVGTVETSKSITKLSKKLYNYGSRSRNDRDEGRRSRQTSLMSSIVADTRVFYCQKRSQPHLTHCHSNQDVKRYNSLVNAQPQSNPFSPVSVDHFLFKYKEEMAFFPDVKSLDKLLNNKWKTFVYGEQSETWNQKLYSFALEAWNQILIFLESRGKQLQNYWPLYTAFIVGSFIILATYKSLRYVGPIKLWNSNKCERRVKHEICAEESKIISDDGNNDTGSFVEKPNTSRSDLDNATPADNDYHSRHDFSVSSATTIVTVEGKETGEFLRNLINSFEPGDDAVNYIVSTKYSREDTVENKDINEIPDSTLQKVDSQNCKHFYVLTPWIGSSEDQKSKPAEKNSSSVLSSDDNNTNIESLTHQRLTSRTEQEEIKKNNHSDLAKSCPPEAATVDTALTDDEKSTGQMMSKTANSTLAIHHESSSVCCADEVLSQISDIRENIDVNLDEEKQSDLTTPTIEPQFNNLEREFGNIVQKLPGLDLSPISPDAVTIQKRIIVTGSEIRTDSKHKFRSISHDNRPVSRADYIEARRGCSASPPARNKNKQRSTDRLTKQIQSKIPTPSPLAHRQMQQHLGTDGTVVETANQIRSVLLRKLREVWEKHPRDRTPSPNRSINSSLDSSVYYTPESVSRIPLPRRSPRSNDASDLTRSPRVSSQSHRSTNQSDQSGPGNFGITNKRIFPINVSSVPLHSTPKTSPLSRGSNQKK